MVLFIELKYFSLKLKSYTERNSSCSVCAEERPCHMMYKTNALRYFDKMSSLSIYIKQCKGCKGLFLYQS